MARSSPGGGTGWRVRTAAVLLLLLVLAACSPGVAPLSGYVGGDSIEEPAEGVPSEPTPPLMLGDLQSDQLMVLIGDSISTGLRTSVSESWPSVLVRALARENNPIRLRNAAENGAGYLVPGEYGRTFAEQTMEALSPDASIVVVYGSENDIGTDISNIPEQMTLIADDVSQRAPVATLIFVGPASYSADVDPELLSIRNEIAQGAQNLGALFVDPIEERWIMGQQDQLIGPDGIHPSRAGHQYLAKKFESLVEPFLEESPPASSSARGGT